MHGCPQAHVQKHKIRTRTHTHRGKHVASACCDDLVCRWFGTEWAMIGQSPSRMRRSWIRYSTICFRRCKAKAKAKFALRMRWRFTIPRFISAPAAGFRSVLFMTGSLVRCHHFRQRKCGLSRCRKIRQRNVQWSRWLILRSLSCCRSSSCMRRLHCVCLFRQFESYLIDNKNLLDIFLHPKHEQKYKSSMPEMDHVDNFEVCQLFPSSLFEAWLRSLSVVYQ